MVLGGRVISNFAGLFDTLVLGGRVISNFAGLFDTGLGKASVLYIFEPFERLHFQHNVCKLSSEVMPPLERGITWSISSKRFASSEVERLQI